MVKTAARKPRLGIGVPRRRRPSGGVPWLRIDPAMPGYPWETAGLHHANFPTPGLFWDANEPTQWLADPHFDEVVRAALGSALLMAGMDPDLATSRTSQSRRLRQQIRQLVLNAPFNDVLYGCTNANSCGGNDPSMPGSSGPNPDLHVMGAKKRGINWLARHADNRQRIATGTSPLRTTTLEGETSELSGRRPLLWIPAVSLPALRDRITIAVDGMTWSDKTPTLEVPPQVRKLGLLDDVRKGES